MRRSLVFVLLICSLGLVGMLGPTSPAAAQARPKPAVTLKLSEKYTLAGNRVAFIGRVKSLRPGTQVFLQERVGRKWVAIGKGKTSPKHKFRIKKRPEAGVHTYRVRVKATPRTRPGHSRTRTVTVYGRSFVTATTKWATPVEGSLTTISGRVTAWTPGNKMVLQELIGGEWLPLRAVDISATGTFSTNVRPTTAWPTYRMVKPDDSSSAAAKSEEMHPRTSPTVALTLGGAPVPLAIPGPGPIGRVTFSGRAGDEVSIDHSASGGAVVIALDDPDGNKLAQWSAAENRLVLPQTGTYELAVYAVTATKSITVAAALTPVANLVLNGAAVPVSSTVGTFVRFYARAGEMVHLTHPATCNTRMTKAGNDTPIAPYIQAPRAIWQIPADAKYEVLVPAACKAGTVSGQILSPETGTVDTTGPNINQTQPFGAGSVRYTLTANTEYTLTPAAAKVDAQWVLQDPAGNNVGRSVGTNGPFTFVAPTTGSYTAYAIPVEAKVGTVSADLCSSQVVNATSWGVGTSINTGSCDGRRVLVRMATLSPGQVPGITFTANNGIVEDSCRLRASSTRASVGSCGQASPTTSGTYEFTFSGNPAGSTATVVPWLVKKSTTTVNAAAQDIVLNSPGQVAWIEFTANAGQTITASSPSVVLPAGSTWQVTVRRARDNYRLAAFGTTWTTTSAQIPITESGTYRMTVTASSPGTVRTRVTNP